MGNIIRKNEAGVQIKKGEKASAYKKWTKNTKIKVQGAGEVEDASVVKNAGTFFSDRRHKKLTASGIIL